MKKKEYKVSICVPIYGVEKYIERCATSIFEQTYTNIEYIFIDDCTPDNSIEILKSVIERYPKRKLHIKIIKNERNCGLGATRNTAINHATGEFIMHVDSDDFVEKNIVEKLVIQQKISDADIVTCGYILYRHNKIKEVLPEPIYNIKKLISKILSRDATMMIWGRLIRKNLYDNNNIFVPEGINMGEDYVTIPKLFYYAKKIDFVKLPLYHYDCYNTGAYTTYVTENKIYQMLKCYDNLRNSFLDEKDYLERIDIGELKYIANAMLNCFANGNNLNNCCSILSNRNVTSNKRLYKYVKLSNRVILYLKKAVLIKLYARTSSKISLLKK